jgi:hypothetical protein
MGVMTLMPRYNPAPDNPEDATVRTARQITATMQELRPIIGYIEGLGKNRGVELELKFESLILD